MKKTLVASTALATPGSTGGPGSRYNNALQPSHLPEDGSEMFITLTRSQGTPEQLRQAAEFLSKFLPRLKQERGVRAVYHFDRPDQGDDYTIIVWEDEAAARAYRQSELVKEAMAFEQSNKLPATREGYPLGLGLSDKI